MSEMTRLRRDDEPRHDPETQAQAPDAPGAPPPPPVGPPFDWHVLLLRYLPQPAGSAHAVKRLAPR
jgi:hypothetical protein